jgi:hypothetical protein
MGVQNDINGNAVYYYQFKKKISNQFIFDARIKTVHGLMKTL